MGVLADVSGPLGRYTSESSTPVLVASGFASFILLSVVLNVLQQLLQVLLREPKEVRQRLYLRPPRPQDDRVSRHHRQQLHFERKDQGCQRREDLLAIDYSRVRQGCRLRLPQLEAHGAEEGPRTTNAD
jgi:hypothetical protein